MVHRQRLRSTIQYASEQRLTTPIQPATVLIAAARGELRPLTRTWAPLKTEHYVEAWQHPSRPIFALCGGMGADAATRAFARALSICEPRQLYSVGWAGSLMQSTQAGAICNVCQILSTQTGERFDLTPETDCSMLLLTTPRVADRDEKLRLKQSYPHACLVDMEAATLARLALANNIPFRAIKAISDTLDEYLPDLNPYIDQHGQFHMLRFAAAATLQPGLWPVLIRFGRQASLAARNLGDALARELNL